MLLLLAPLVMPAATGAQPAPTAVDHVDTLEVGAASEWRETGITVVPGDRLVMIVAGEASDEREVAVGPMGREDDGDEAKPMPGAPFGALIGRIGSNVFLVGAGYDGIAKTQGSLALKLNLPDSRSGELQGGYEVTITRYPAPPPSPQPDLKPDLDPDPVEPELKAGAVDAKGPAVNAVAPVQTPVLPVAPARKAVPTPTAPPIEEPDESTFPWLLLAGILAVAAATALGLSQWRRTRLSTRTQARLAVAQSLSLDPSDGSRPPPELRPAWPAVGTRWRMEEREPAFGGWAGEEGRDG